MWTQFSDMSIFYLSLLKKLFKSSEHSSSMIPPKHSGLKLNGISKRFVIVPHAPFLKSYAPKNTFGMWALMIAPAHIGQGSSVT